MKHYILVLLLLLCSFNLSAGIIVLATGENIEDISNISIQGQSVTYVQKGKSKSLPIEDVSAILYDNGNYEEVHHSSTPSVSFDDDVFSNTDNTIPSSDNYSQSAANRPNKADIEQQRAQKKAENKETMQALGNWMKSAFKGDKDGWNPAKNPLWNKESRAKYSNENYSEQPTIKNNLKQEAPQTPHLEQEAPQTLQDDNW